MNVRIDIKLESFNNEYYADISLAHNKIIYRGSDDLSMLMDIIKNEVLKYKEEIKSK
jgi:hypothetical protein